MPEIQPEPTVRENKVLRQKIEELTARLEKLEKISCAMLDGWVELEDDTAGDYMPKGDFYGRKFD